MRYQIQQWIRGFVIRDCEEDVYIRDWTGDIVVYSLGDASEKTLRMNQLDQESEWESWCDAMGYDPEEYAYQDDDYPGYEEDYQESRYYPLGNTDAVDYAGQQH